MKKNKTFNIFTDIKKNVLIHFAFLFALLVWFFTITMMPVNYQNSGDLTVIYSKNINLYLSPLGIVTVILFILFIIHSIFMLSIFIFRKQSFWLFKNLSKKMNNWYFLVGWIILFIILVMMFGFIYSIPNTTEFSERLIFKEFITSLDSSNITQQQHDVFIGYVNKFRWSEQLKALGLANYNDFLGSNISLNSSIISFLQNVYVNFEPSYFTPLFNVSSNAAIVSPVYYFNIVIFSLSLIYFSLSSFVLFLINNKVLANRKSFQERKEMFKIIANDFKQKIKAKKENKAKRKLLLKEEEELLVGLDAFESQEEIPTISQEELQEKISKNNELKNRILEIQSQQKKLKEDSRFFKSKNQKEEINKRSTKIKKHEITIPDDELEEIFKNLDI